MDFLTRVFWQQIDIPILLVLLNMTLLCVFVFGNRNRMYKIKYLLGFIALRVVVQLSYLLSVHYQINSNVLYILLLAKVSSYLLLNIYSWKFISLQYKHVFLKTVYFIPTIATFAVILFVRNVDIQQSFFLFYKVFTILAGAIALIPTRYLLKNSLPPIGHCRTKKTYFTFRVAVIIYAIICVIDLPLISLENFNQLTGNLYDMYLAKYCALFLMSVTMLFTFVYTSMYDSYYEHHHSGLIFANKMSKYFKQFVVFYILATFVSSSFVIIMGSTATREVKTPISGTTRMSSLAISSLEYENLLTPDLTDETILGIKYKLEKLEASDKTIWAPRVYVKKENQLITIGPRHFTPSDPTKISVSDFENAPLAVQKIYNDNSTLEFEWPHVTQDGVFCSSFAPILSDDGELYGVMALNLYAPFWHEANLARRTIPCIMMWLIMAFIGVFIKDNQNYQVSQSVAQIDHELLLQTQELAQVGSWITNPHSSKFIWFEGLDRILNIPHLESTASNETILSLVCPEDKELISKLFENADAGIAGTQSCRLLLGNNDVKYVVISIKPIRERSNQIQLVLATLQDISQVKLLEEDVLFKKAMDKSDLMSIGFRSDGTLIYMNDAYEKNVGWNFEELTANKWSSNIILSTSLTMDILEMLSSADETTVRPELSHFEMAIRTKSNETILVEWNGTTIQESNGQIASYHFIGDNITEKRRLEELVLQKKLEAETANRSKSMFLANMSHEIRTPMNAILGFSEILSADKTLGDKQKEFIRTISKSGEHLLSLINDILEMSKIEAGSVTFNPSTIDVLAMISEIRNMFVLRTNAKAISFSIECDDLPRYIFTDENKIRQIFINLLSNAVKFTNEGGITWVTKCTTLNGQSILVVEIADTGTGINEEELAHIFLPFEQSESGKIQAGGTGLGLAISRELARFMNGDILVKSEYGQGTVFRVELPIEIADSANLSHPETDLNVVSIANDKHPIILAVDDKDDNLQVLRELLPPVGFIVVEAHNGKEAVEYLENESVDLILMDMRMPVMDGYEASQKIRESKHLPHIPIVALTASAFEEDKQRVFDVGIDDFIRKPFHRKVLFNVIKKYLPIDYIYEDRFEEVSLQNTDVNLTAVPTGLLENLAESISTADFNEAIEILNQMKEFISTSELKQIRSLIDTFQYEKITEMLSGILPNNG